MKCKLALVVFLLSSSANAYSQVTPRSTVVTVGPNVQVSKDRPSIMHGESAVGLDRKDPRRLIACSMAYLPDKNVVSVLAYLSLDTGKTWRQVFEYADSQYAGDPVCDFLPDGTAYIGLLDLQAQESMKLFRSRDGGKSWTPSVFPSWPPLDREFVVVDRSGGANDGRVYMTAQFKNPKVIGGAAGQYSMGLWRSFDNGASFQRPVARQVGSREHFHPGNPVVLSDGTVVCSFTQMLTDENGSELPFSDRRANAKLWVMNSTDGGDSLTDPVLLTDIFALRRRNTGVVMPSLASDWSNSAFRDRLYIVWPDARSGRTQILFSYSSDKGKSWSRPRRVNDDRDFPEGQGPDDYLPTIAVNNAGVVGVMWQDRRDNPDNLGSSLRFAASIDGGDSFLPSVRVSENRRTYESVDHWSIQSRVNDSKINESRTKLGEPHKITLTLSWFDYDLVGHTDGLTTAPDGTFYATWCDKRTGVMQLWGAVVNVNGSATKNGSRELSNFEDVSELVALQITNLSYDRDSGVAALDLRVKNVSNRALHGPFKLRLTTIDSEVGVPSVLNAEDGSVAGSVLDLTGCCIPGDTLQPDQSSTPLRLKVRISQLLLQKAKLKGLLNLNMRVLAMKETVTPTQH